MTFTEQEIARDSTRGRVGRIVAINGDCLVLRRPDHEPWDALTSWCMPATVAECQDLEEQEGAIAAVVYVTPTGSFYHGTPKCMVLERAGDADICVTSPEKARQRHLTPCPLCGGA
ncbi:hypothetical protein [Streptomyces sp. NPDC093097]|uniref:hypothetical protein n=1 Tax=Streptomyces sp. NPDC093097 TaxID=3366027 RepID=UPI003821860A